MSNFTFLTNEFETLRANSVKSETYAISDPDVSAICARKALESSVKFIYTVDPDLDKKFLKGKDLLRLTQNPEFTDIVPSEIVSEMHYVRKLGNGAVHSNEAVSSKSAMYANQCIYKLQRWMVEVYSGYEVEDDYDLTLLLPTKEEAPSKEELLRLSKEQEALEEENAKLQAQIDALMARSSKPAPSAEQKKEHVVKVKGLSEKETRERLIDLELTQAGYEVEKFSKGYDEEFKLILDDGSVGYADYVIWGEDGNPLAVIEAKKASVSVTSGKHQARRYAQALQKEYGVDVLLFVTNGRVIEYSDGDSAFREIHSIFPRAELSRALMKKKAMKRSKPSGYEIDKTITDRGYQKRVIDSVLRHYESQQSRALLVMATGTGKTRVSASIADILIRAGWVRKVLFLADRKELVKQASNNFSKFLDETTVNLVKEKEDLDARMHFGTYETVHNLIDKGKYNSAYFDLIVVDEAHRTIYKKYRAVFEYFDAFVLGLTATPADEVHRNTYNFFRADEGEPTDSYGLRRAIDDGYLVDFKPYEIDLGIVKRGMKYSDLSEDEKEHWEDTFDEEEEEISSDEINKRVLNKQTNEKVLQYLHQHGFKIDEGNKIGKTIIFAKNKKHAEYIKKVYDNLYPSRAKEAQIIHSEISHVESLLEDFKNPNKNPQIAISVDMLDTGIDVPELLNLVFFKPIKSKIKFWQMIGRGTRLCPNLFGEGEHKTSFNIFDFCGNFSYFDIHSEGLPAQRTTALKERLFKKRVALLEVMEAGDAKDALREKVQMQVHALDASAYHLKSKRHVLQALQEADFKYMTDELKSNLYSISEYIEDETDVQVQRYEMLTLNAQDAIVNQKEGSKFTDEIKQRCYILKSHVHNIGSVKEQEPSIDAVLEGTNALTSIEELETLKNDIAHLANLSLSKSIKSVESDFRDRVEDVRTLSSADYVKEASVETEVHKVLSSYIDKLSSLEVLKDSEFISDDDINTLKHQVFNYEKMVEDRLKNRDEFATVMQEVMNHSQKEIANKIFDNYIEVGNYTQKQIEVSNKIKNILFGKKYATLSASIDSVREELTSEFHDLANNYERLSEEEQESIVELMALLSALDSGLNVRSTA